MSLSTEFWWTKQKSTSTRITPFQTFNAIARFKMAESARLNKPQLRGLLASQIKKNLMVAGVLCVVFVTATKIFRNDPRKRDYAEFYKNYDPEAAFQRMVDAGLMQCVEDRD